MLKIHLVVQVTVDYNFCGGYGDRRRSNVAIRRQFQSLPDTMSAVTANE